MVTFVGAEYIIANSLIALKKAKNRTNISLGELNQLGIYIQQMSIENDVDAVFLVSQDQVTTAVYDFGDYFEYNAVEKLICIKQTKQITDLASRFVGYLPWEIMAFLVKTTNEFVKKSA
ncbi:MAG: hypothetical protein K2N15_13980 [Lachnospiraceae bacterium]|nr:hypothetical protein [Lachnospiraceae bacterium]